MARAGLEVMNVPMRFVNLADRRTQPLIQASVAWPDALRVIARSCYLQGLSDAQDVYETARIPELPKIVRCVHCNETNQIGWLKCWKCGAALPEPEVK